MEFGSVSGFGQVISPPVGLSFLVFEMGRQAKGQSWDMTAGVPRPASNILCSLGFSTAGGGCQCIGWVKCEGKGTWSRRLGLVTMGSVTLGPDVLRF